MQAAHEARACEFVVADRDLVGRIHANDAVRACLNVFLHSRDGRDARIDRGHVHVDRIFIEEPDERVAERRVMDRRKNGGMLDAVQPRTRDRHACAENLERERRRGQRLVDALSDVSAHAVDEHGDGLSHAGGCEENRAHLVRHQGCCGPCSAYRVPAAFRSACVPGRR